METNRFYSVIASTTLVHATSVKRHAALLGRLPIGALVRLSPGALGELDPFIKVTS